MKERLFLVTVVTMVLGMLAAACGGGDTAAPKSTAATSTPRPTALPTQAGKTVGADIKNVKHLDLSIEVGTTVVWTQRDNNVHTTTSGSPGNPTGLWDSDPMRKGDTFKHTFTQVGAFPYFCEIHGSIMTATVTVVESLEE